MCQSEMSDKRLSSLTWQGLEWPWLSSADKSEGRNGKEHGRDNMWEKGSRCPPSFNQTGQLSTFFRQRNCGALLSEIARVVLPLANFRLWMDEEK